MGTFCCACIMLTCSITAHVKTGFVAYLSNTAYDSGQKFFTYQWTQTDQLKYTYTSDWIHMHFRQTQNSQNSGMQRQNNHLYLKQPFVSIFTALFKYQGCCAHIQTHTHMHTRRSTADIPVSRCSPKCLINIPLGVKALEQETMWKV